MIILRRRPRLTFTRVVIAFGILAVALLVLLVIFTVFPPPVVTVVAAPQGIARGGDVTVVTLVGKGSILVPFQPEVGATVNVVATSPTGAVVPAFSRSGAADASGLFSYGFTVPLDAATGVYTITASTVVVGQPVTKTTTLIVV